MPSSEFQVLRPPCVLHEDDHLLVVDKPAGWNTHAPDPFAGEGIYDWLRHHERRWADLAILHRLDKETSGVILFGKTGLANRALTAQFTQRDVQKKYLLLTDRSIKRKDLVVRSKIVRRGDRYVSAPAGEAAETKFHLVDPQFGSAKWKLIEAEPLTGRTHQIRVHAAENGFPILGDTIYGGSPFNRVCLHAAELTVQDPATGKALTFRSAIDFHSDSRLNLRAALIDPRETNAFRVMHGAADSAPNWYVDRLGEFLLSQSESGLSDERRLELMRLVQLFKLRGAYHKTLSRRISGTPGDAAPKPVQGEAAPERFVIRENGLQFQLSFSEGYSTGLFLDQRDNRRRLLTGHVAADFPLFDSRARIGNEPTLLNCFAYTCGFSVCAARAGMKTTSLDLSRKYLEWGKRNFVLNDLDPAAHEFIYGDVFDWLRRMTKKKQKFDLLLLDPPTFSQSKEHGVFRAEKDYSELIQTALPLVASGGVLFASTNAAGIRPENFVATGERIIQSAGRQIVRRHYAPQPPDFPVSRSEPAHLKTVWWRLG